MFCTYCIGCIVKGWVLIKGWYYLRHNGAPSPLFHSPLDRLAVPRISGIADNGEPTRTKGFPVIVIYCTRAGRAITTVCPQGL